VTDHDIDPDALTDERDSRLLRLSAARDALLAEILDIAHEEVFRAAGDWRAAAVWITARVRGDVHWDIYDHAVEEYQVAAALAP